MIINTYMKHLFLLLLTSLSAIVAYAQDHSLASSDSSYLADESVCYVQRGDQALPLDIFYPSDNCARHKCVVFIYGGAFLQNNLRTGFTQKFCRRLADESGFVVVAIDYRLGLVGQKFTSKLAMVKPLENAMYMAVEDCGEALAYVLRHAVELRVDPEKIILCGSSAGAMTALQTDYEICNRTGHVSCLPEDFHPAGVVSFAGAVYSVEGKPKYKLHDPAPTMLLHGTDDNLVIYDKIAFFNRRLSGSNDLVKVFKKNHYPHQIIRFKGERHGVAARMMDNYEQMMWFVDNFIDQEKDYEMDGTWWDRSRKKSFIDEAVPSNVFK